MCCWPWGAAARRACGCEEHIPGGASPAIDLRLLDGLLAQGRAQRDRSRSVARCPETELIATKYNLLCGGSGHAAPLPLLGVGAAFGSIRKLRKFSSQLKTFSMG